PTRCVVEGTATGVDDAVVATTDLGYAYTPLRFAIRHLTLEIHRGEIFGLLGRNGAGKTTTVRVLSTLVAPSEGTGTLFGKEFRRCGRAERNRTGVILQSESYDTVSVYRNLLLYGFLRGVPRETSKARAEELLTLFELADVRDQTPWTISGGQRRRFQVARELMHDMELLFLDEATVGVDAITRNRILEYLQGRARNGLAIMFTTHILSEADRICDRIGVIHDGRLLRVASPADVRKAHSGTRTVEIEFGRAPSEAERNDLAARLAKRGVSFQTMEEKDVRFCLRHGRSRDSAC
ncbi:daunorubicin resistance ABC transporter ATPase subunit, partial [mine drainage metagenome]